MHRGHQWNAREIGDPRSDEASGEPPVRMNEGRLELATDPGAAGKAGTEEPEQGELRAERTLDLLGHLSRVGKSLEATGCVPEAVHGNPVEDLVGGKVIPRRRDHGDVHV